MENKKKKIYFHLPVLSYMLIKSDAGVVILILCQNTKSILNVLL